ncbi:hypothetical protein BDV41DRAFT_379629 [Aspergillus transmontanensis]|uniref:Uncharacterized protein n=1 Tax=Aspergillus transmontanensis TaxID=1034304 RepID=A0A5N6WCD1_9EURO|nr:hypothetical protein BDV41DRAFT_379629 [Aspergillus transmontanensis]
MRFMIILRYLAYLVIFLGYLTVKDRIDKWASAKSIVGHAFKQEDTQIVSTFNPREMIYLKTEYDSTEKIGDIRQERERRLHPHDVLRYLGNLLIGKS